VATDQLVITTICEGEARIAVPISQAIAGKSTAWLHKTSWGVAKVIFAHW